MALLSTVASCSIITSHGHSSSTRHGLWVIRSLNFSPERLSNVTKSGTIIGRRQGLQIRMQRGAGFGQKSTEAKTKHKILTLDISKAEAVESYKVFARKLVQGEPISKWEPIGEILLENGSDLEIALKERRKKLLAAAKHQYPGFMVLNIGEELQYGFEKVVEETNGARNDDEITVVDVKGKEPDVSVPAILRADDGTKPPPKRR